MSIRCGRSSRRDVAIVGPLTPRLLLPRPPADSTAPEGGDSRAARALLLAELDSTRPRARDSARLVQHRVLAAVVDSLAVRAALAVLVDLPAPAAVRAGCRSSSSKRATSMSRVWSASESVTSITPRF